MGYDLHITRAKFWSENIENQISSDEWLSIIANDEELTLVKENGLYFAKWSEEEAWFDWFEGDIYTKSPNQNVINKMIQIAILLHAKVQGDDGEIYKDIKNDQDNSSPNLQPKHEHEYNQSSPHYLRKEFLQNIILFAIVAIVIVAANLLDLW